MCFFIGGYKSRDGGTLGLCKRRLAGQQQRDFFTAQEPSDKGVRFSGFESGNDVDLSFGQEALEVSRKVPGPIL